MKKILFSMLLLVSAALTAQQPAQSRMVYNAFKAGLSMRDKPGTGGAVLLKIPYGEKLKLVNPYDDTVSVINEGMRGYWNLVEYKGKKGYVVGIYLFDMAPPKATVKTMQEYFAQISAPAGAPVVSTRNKEGHEMYSSFKKQLYKNGCEVHEASFYESGYNTYFIPEMDMQQAFILVRLIPEFKDVFSSTDSYPSENRKVKVKRDQYESEKEINVQFVSGGNWMEKITVNYEDGAMYTFELFQISGQVVISFGGGV